jgi:hypothetical protein
MVETLLTESENGVLRATSAGNIFQALSEKFVIGLLTRWRL